MKITKINGEDFTEEKFKTTLLNIFTDTISEKGCTSELSTMLEDQKYTLLFEKTDNHAGMNDNVVLPFHRKVEWLSQPNSHQHTVISNKTEYNLPQVQGGYEKPHSFNLDESIEYITTEKLGGILHQCSVKTMADVYFTKTSAGKKGVKQEIKDKSVEDRIAVALDQMTNGTGFLIDPNSDVKVIKISDLESQRRFNKQAEPSRERYVITLGYSVNGSEYVNTLEIKMRIDQSAPQSAASSKTIDAGSKHK
jgi:hypothetical protein